MRRFVVLVTLVVGLLLARTLCAATPESSESGVVVVVVAPDAVELDVARVRAAIGQELTSDAVGPDDARASSARGRIDVSIDRGARQLVVSYRGAGAEALVRSVDLPGDAEATLRAAVLLAGNLARDEATEIVAELRKPKEATVSAPPLPPPVARPPSSDADELARSERLRRLLADYAARDRHARLVVAWSVLGVGVAVDGVALYQLTHSGENAVGSLFPTGLALTIGSVVSIFVPSTFERMSTYYEDHATTPFPSWLREDMEHQWKRAAERAKKARVFAGVGILVLGALSAADGFLLWEGEPRSLQNVVSNSIAIGTGVAAIPWGIVTMATESSVESRLHEYERGLDHPIEPADVGLRVTPVRGGVVAGLGGRF